MTRRLTLLFAIASGAAVGNLYWSQPLLDYIAGDLGTSPALAGLLVTATQIGYAVGVLLFVPLGDVLNRRVLVPVALLCSAAALLASALAPTFGVLLATLALVGLTTVAGQVLVPLAGDLADDAHRGRIVGTVVSGILVGILVSRTVAGLVAAAAGWRAIYLAAAALAVVLAVLLFVLIPRIPARAHLAYPALIASVFRIVAREQAVRWHLVLGGTSFLVFTMFWTSLTFLLASPPFSFGTEAIGLFGLVGLAGAAAAGRVGHLSDRGLGLPVIGAAWALVLLSFVGAGIAGAAAAGTAGASTAASVVGIVVAIFVLDVAIQGHNVTVQSRMFRVDPAARSRLNTAFVTNNFLWGAAGSALASVLWSAGGWTAVTIAGAVFSGFALSVWLVGRRGGLHLAGEGRGAGTRPSPAAA